MELTEELLRKSSSILNLEWSNEKKILNKTDDIIYNFSEFSYSIAARKESNRWMELVQHVDVNFKYILVQSN